MSTQVTVTLPQDLYEPMRRWADLTQRDLPETLTDVLTIALSPARVASELEAPISSLSGKDALALSKEQPKPSQGKRLSDLLERQRESTLTEQECSELVALMQVYNHLWIHQSRALAEAVQRGLLSPLEP